MLSMRKQFLAHTHHAQKMQNVEYQLRKSKISHLYSFEILVSFLAHALDISVAAFQYWPLLHFYLKEHFPLLIIGFVLFLCNLMPSNLSSGFAFLPQKIFNLERIITTWEMVRTEDLCSIFPELTANSGKLSPFPCQNTAAFLSQCC